MAENLNDENAEILRRLNALLREQADNTGNLTDAQRDLIKAQQDAEKIEKELAESRKAAMNNLKDGLVGMASAANNTERSMSKYSGSFNKFGDAALELGKQFGIAGTIIGGTVKAFTMVTERVLLLNDQLLKQYDTFAKLGATSSLTTKQILELGHKAGYSSGNLEIFTKNAAGLGENLVTLGKSSSGGVKAFAELANITDDQRKQFLRMGISQEEVTEMQATYVKQMAMAGNSLNKPVADLRKESVAYIENLQKLAEITGIDIKKQQEAMNAALAQENFNAFLNQQEQKAAELRLQAEKEQDPIRKKQLQAQAEQIDASVKAKKEFGALAQATMSQSNATAVLESISTEGAVVYGKNNAKLLMAGIDIEKMNKNLNKGENQNLELRREQALANKRFNETFGEAGYRFGDSSRKLQETFGIDNKMRAQATKDARLLTEEGYRQAKREQEQKDAEYELKKQNLQKDKDAATEARAEQEMAEKEYRQAVDKLTDIVRGPVTKVFMAVTTTFTQFLTFFIKLTSSLLEGIGSAIDFVGSIIDGIKDFMKKVSSWFSFKMPEKPKTVPGAPTPAAPPGAPPAAGKAPAPPASAAPAAPAPAPAAPTPAAPAPAAPAAPAPTPAAPTTAAPAPAAPAGGRREPEVKPPPLATPGIAPPTTAPPVAAKPPGAAKPVDTSSLLAKLQESGITDKRAQANILAQIKAESGFKPRSEELEKYSAKTLFNLYGPNQTKNKVRFKSMEEAQAIVDKGPEAVGDVIYGGRMGNVQAGEGYKYRGRGLIQLTGKDNYAKYSKLIGVDLVKDPDLANDPDIAQKLAVAYFKEKEKKVNLSDIRQVGTAVGYAGGEKETQKRAEYAQAFMQTLPQAQKGGIFDGPEFGFPVALHGKEIVTPIDPNSILMKLATTAASQQTQMPESIAEGPSMQDESVTYLKDLVALNTDMVTLLSEKFDSMISALSEGNSLQDKLLKYSRV